jgi:hypothetical protein
MDTTEMEMILSDQTIAWNRDRQNLDKFDPQLEVRMLTEEAMEFFQARTYEHMLQEYADFIFVKDGTYAKYYGQGNPGLTMFQTGVEAFASLDKWCKGTETHMLKCLTDKAIKEGFFQDDIPKHIVFSRSCVVAANNAKPIKKIDGKVIKGDKHQDPLNDIERFINQKRQEAGLCSK